MKSLHTLILTMLLAFGLTSIGNSQACNNYINVSLANTGTAKIYAENVLEGNPSDYTNLSWEFLTYDCSDIGEHDYTISGLYQGNPFTCSGIIKIEDKLGPIAVCDLGIVVTVETDTLWLTPDLVDEGSYDNCSSVSLTITPNFVTTVDIGQFVTTVLEATDADGNTNSCWTQILVQGEFESLACTDMIELYVTSSGQYQLQAEDVIANEYNNPVSLSLVDSNQDTVPDNIITADYLGQTLTYTVTDLTNGNLCWGTISVLEPSNVEMVCNGEVNVTLTVDQSFEVSANEVLLKGNPVGRVVVVYADGEAVQGNLLTNDLMGQLITYELLDENINPVCGGSITLEACIEDYDPFIVCDTKSRATIINDCLWAHTSTDNVEWPADITMNLSETLTEENLDDHINLEALGQNNLVDMRDIEPRFVGGCFALSVTYNDQPLPTDQGYKVVRTWTVLDWNGNVTYNYTQIINIDGLASNVEDIETQMLAIKSNPVNQSIQFVDAIDQSLNYQIVSLTGQQLMSGKIQQDIDVSSLAEGYYFLRVITESQVQVIKFELLR